jgi:hypothetical protein
LNIDKNESYKSQLWDEKEIGFATEVSQEKKAVESYCIGDPASFRYLPDFRNSLKELQVKIPTEKNQIQMGYLLKLSLKSLKELQVKIQMENPKQIWLIVNIVLICKTLGKNTN